MRWLPWHVTGFIVCGLTPWALSIWYKVYWMHRSCKQWILHKEIIQTMNIAWIDHANNRYCMHRSSKQWILNSRFGHWSHGQFKNQGTKEFFFNNHKNKPKMLKNPSIKAPSSNPFADEDEISLIFTNQIAIVLHLKQKNTYLEVKIPQIREKN